MDVCKYINSKAVREHLRKLNWEFTSLEAAWFVWKWRGPVEERLAAWQQIIDEMPDQEVKAGHYFDGCPSLHDFLRETISVYRKCVERFFDNTDAYYTFYTKLADGSLKPDAINYSSCPIKDNKAECSGILRDLEGDSAILFEMWKKYFDNEESRECRATFDRNLDMIAFEDHSKEWKRLDDMFSSHFFYFPVPFRKGDIIYRIDDWFNTPMVYIDCRYDHIKDMNEYLYSRRRDITDMSIDVYKVDLYYEPQWDTVGDVTDYDFFDEDLARKYVSCQYDYRRLKTYKMILLLSATLTGRLGLELVFKEYNQLKNDNRRSYLVDELFVKLANEEQKRGYYHAKEIARKYPKAMKVLGVFEESDPYEKT